MKTVKNLFCILTLTASMLMSCSEDLGFGEDIYNQESRNELLQEAKNIVQNQNGIVPLPVNGGANAQSRSGMSVITEGTPLWDYVKYYNIDGMHVLMVELQTAEKVYSRITATRDGVTETQESETFSRLVIRKKADKLYAHVLTYMPDVDYASANKERLDTIDYYPKYVDFTGITLTSHLDGSVYRGIRYENGKMASVISKNQHTECDHNHGSCNHNHEIEHTTPININLFTQSSQQPQSRELRGTCPDCKIQYDDNMRCWCMLPNEGKMCDKCNTRSVNDTNFCLCCGYWESEPPKENTCPICGKEFEDKDYADGHICLPDFCQNCGYENCVCPEPEPCKDCGQYSCICPSPNPNPTDTCDVCHEDPCICCKKCNAYPCVCPCEKCGEHPDNCICVINSFPIEYSPHDNDVFGAFVDECVEPNTCCAMAVLEMAYKAFEGEELTQEMFSQYYLQFNYMSPNEEETILNYNDSFMNHFFETSSLSSMTAEINNNNVIVVRKNQHYVLVFGLQYDGDVIYADPHEGGIYAVSENYFNGCDAFVIEGINQNRMRMLLQ